MIGSSILRDMRRPRLRGNGEGTVYKAGGERDRPWVAVLVVGWRLDGKPIRRARFASSEQAAKALLADMRKARQAGRALPDERMTVSKFMTRWIVLQAPRVRPSTLRHYRFMTDRYILPVIGGTPLSDLRASHVDAMLDAIPNANTASNCRAVLSRSLRDAQRDRIVIDNVASLATPRGRGRRHEAPSPETVRAVLDALASHRLHALYILAASTGLRLGEVCGLRWSDWADERLLIALQLRATHDPAEPFVLGPVKTDSSAATIILPGIAIRALERQHVRQAAEQLRAGDRWRNVNDLVFTTVAGDPLPPSTVDYVLRNAARHIGARLSMHDFRRFAATAVGATGDLKASQALLRHEQIDMTSWYASETDAARRRAAQAMQEALA